MDAEYEQSYSKLQSILQKLGLASNVEELQQKHEEIEGDISYKTRHKSELENASKVLEDNFRALINKYHSDMVNIAFDGFMSNKMLKAAADWETEETEHFYSASVQAVNEIVSPEMEPQQLIEYLCSTVQKVRPQYSKNTIVNIVLCMTQGFLTVFSGEPGCGKTSICNILADVLGLNKLDHMIANRDNVMHNLGRYISISVERGWTSKRDFVGYFNPISKTFDKSNRRVYEALKMLDIEWQKNISNYPFMILLDEANLSPMEYYWADFMNICDDLSSNHQINLGNEYIFNIPETLHFVATINNDHTTEILSPRLIDRAWIVTLPQVESQLITDGIPDEQIETVSWESIKKAFLPDSNKVMTWPQEVSKIYDSTLVPHLKKERIFISPRTHNAIRKYWSIASLRFDKDEQYETDPSIVALDYAVAQKILPKIIGNGDEFCAWLEEFRNICSKFNLHNSSKLIKDIIDRGNKQMKYYQFFG